MKSYALIFPGLGYGSDRPLLYYSRKIAEKQGYNPIIISYPDLPRGDRNDSAWLEDCILRGRVKADGQLLSCLDELKKSDRILCIGKSIGTAISAAWCTNHNIKASYVMLTPLEQTFSYPVESALVLRGTSDPWFTAGKLPVRPWSGNYTEHLFKDANHSLETGNVAVDIEYLGLAIEKVSSYIAAIAARG